MNFRPLSVRTAGRDEGGPYEGVPPHMAAHLVAWVDGALTTSGGYTRTDAVEIVALRLAVPMPVNAEHMHRSVLVNAAASDDTLMLDCIDLLLLMGLGDAAKLGRFLSLGGSVWTVAEDDKSLERRVSDEEAAAKAAAVAPADAVAQELATAWGSAFGVRPNASDAWDHAIKALEALLIPIVVPNQSKATLGHVVGAMKADPSRWTLDLQSNGDLSDGATLLALLQLVWANPDRHANSHQRTPSQEEAEKIVKIAVLVVGLCRGGALHKAQPNTPQR